MGYFNSRLESPNKEWLRVDGQLRLRFLSKVAQLRRKGLDLRVQLVSPVPMVQLVSPVPMVQLVSQRRTERDI